MVSGGRGEVRDVLSEDLPRELLHARLTATLATFAGDGSIHVVAMWFLWDGDAVLIPTSHATRKVRNLERDPRATVMIDDSDRKSTRLNSSHIQKSRMPSSA